MKSSFMYFFSLMNRAKKSSTELFESVNLYLSVTKFQKLLALTFSNIFSSPVVCFFAESVSLVIHIKHVMCTSWEELH